MKFIDFKSIANLNISPSLCVEWVKEVFIHKGETILPPKISIKMPENIFFNTMPAYLPHEKKFGVKVVSRYPKRIPSLQSDIMLYDSTNGELLSIMDGLWITTMRTGAVAALTIKYLRKKNTQTYGFIGIGNTARASQSCLISQLPNEEIIVNLLEYKDQAELFIERFRSVSNIKFKKYSSCEKLIEDSDVVVSCVTAADTLFARDEVYQKGVLVVPVHTRGFQNCDLFFDKIFADDTKHICDFKYFSQFKNFDEFPNVITGNNLGRTSENERILCYNIGIALHDVYFASKLFNIIDTTIPEYLTGMHTLKKFWV